MARTRPRTAKTVRKRQNDARYLFVLGGVLSGVGKGTTISALGRILISKGYRVTALKTEAYLNVDAGTMNPIEHGEVFVTADGIETDQDLGNYERFLEIETGRDNFITHGMAYQAVINRERNLEYGGKCVEPFYHVPLEVIRRFEFLGKKSKADIVLIEIGGTVGEYQNLIYLEAARILKHKHPDRVQFALVSYLPIPTMVGEMKTKPTQHAVHTLQSSGIQPDFVFGRAQRPLDQRRKEKISLLCDVTASNVISAPDVDSIYDIPANLDNEQVGEKILAGFGLKAKRRDLTAWKSFVRKIHRLTKEVRIGIVGKYFVSGSFTLSDSYISVIEAIKHAAWTNNLRPRIEWINAEEFEESPQGVASLKTFHGIVVPGGFGSRGTKGKLAAIRFAREQRIPFFGLCFGMQHAVIEFAQNVLKIRDANSTEIDPTTKHPVIALMEEQKERLRLKAYGGTMRLGNYRCRIVPRTHAAKFYRARFVAERHRHRYEFNNVYRERLEKAGLRVSGVNPESNLVEIVELSDHPFFIGTQFHPEFLSRPMSPHPLFKAFLAAAASRTP